MDDEAVDRMAVELDVGDFRHKRLRARLVEFN
jgi:hypothetical protein